LKYKVYFLTLGQTDVIKFSELNTSVKCAPYILKSAVLHSYNNFFS